MRFNNDKLKRHLKTTSNYIRFGTPYVETTNEIIKPYISDKTNRIINKVTKVSSGITNILDTITE